MCAYSCRVFLFWVLPPLWFGHFHVGVPKWLTVKLTEISTTKNLLLRDNGSKSECRPMELIEKLHKNCIFASVRYRSPPFTVSEDLEFSVRNRLSLFISFGH